MMIRVGEGEDIQTHQVFWVHCWCHARKKNKKTPLPVSVLVSRIWTETMTLNLSSLLSAPARCLPSSCYLPLSACRLCWWWTWCLLYYWSHNLIHLMHRVHGAPSNRIGNSLCNLFAQQIKFAVNAGAGEQNLFCSQKNMFRISLSTHIQLISAEATRNTRWHTADWRALSCSTPSV